MTVELIPGLQVICTKPDRHFLVEGRTYTVREVWPTGFTATCCSMSGPRRRLAAVLARAVSSWPMGVTYDP